METEKLGRLKERNEFWENMTINRRRGEGCRLLIKPNGVPLDSGRKSNCPVGGEISCFEDKSLR